MKSSIVERVVGYSVFLLIGFCGFAYYSKPIEIKPFVKFDYNPSNERVARNEAIINGLRPEYFIAKIKQESGFKAAAISSTGNIGCGQLSKYALKVLGMTIQDALNCKKSIAGAARWLAHYGYLEIGTMDEYQLSAWYYCGINLYGKVIYDKHYKTTEVCGSSYALAIQRASNGSSREPREFARLNNKIKKESQQLAKNGFRRNY